MMVSYIVKFAFARMYLRSTLLTRHEVINMKNEPKFNSEVNASVKYEALNPPV